MAEVKVPELAESITEGTIAQWLKQPGDMVEKGEYIVELETDKVNVEIISDYAGVLKEQLKEEGDTVLVGESIAIVDADGAATGNGAEETPAEETPKTAEQPKESEQPRETEQVEEKKGNQPIASPSARKLAREKGIDLGQVQTNDPLGRVRKHDVEAFNNQPSQPKTPQAPKKAEAPKSTPAAASGKPEERIKMSRRRQTIAKRLVEVQHNTAMLTTFNEVDMTNIMNLRKKRKDAFLKENDVKLGFMSFFTKAVVGSLKKYPLLNAEIQGDELLLKKYYDIGVAVSAPEGLVVPVVRDADRMNFAEIEREIGTLAKKARDNKLALQDLQGGTFTITNGGVFGSLMSTPILNGTQVGILGMHGIKLRPIAIDETTIENRPMMYIALSYDHRIVDGKEAVSFLANIKKLIEDPESLLLEG